MAGEKRPFPLYDSDGQSIDISETKKKRQCISSEFLKRHSDCTVDTGQWSAVDKTSMEYENCTHIYQKDGEIATEDFQNGYSPHDITSLKNIPSVHGGYSVHQCSSIHDGNSLQNGYNIHPGSSMHNGDSQQMEFCIQNGYTSSLHEETWNNNNNSVSSVCIRCQAGEPGHIGHIGR